MTVYFNTCFWTLSTVVLFNSEYREVGFQSGEILTHYSLHQNREGFSVSRVETGQDRESLKQFLQEALFANQNKGPLQAWQSLKGSLISLLGVWGASNPSLWRTTGPPLRNHYLDFSAFWVDVGKQFSCSDARNCFHVTWNTYEQVKSNEQWYFNCARVCTSCMCKRMNFLILSLIAAIS